MTVTMAYAGTRPWEGIGHDINPGMSPQEMVEAAGLNWTVSKRPLGLLAYPEEDGAPLTYAGRVIPGKYGLTRDSDGQFLSLCGSQYKPIQNEEAFAFFKKFTDAGHMTMESAGSLNNGKFVWGLAKLADSFRVGRAKDEDDVDNYLMLLSPFEQYKGFMALYTSLRRKCWNTLSWTLGSKLAYAIGASVKNAAGQVVSPNGKILFRMSHSTYFGEEAKAKAEVALGLAMEQTVQFKAISNLLAKTKLGDAGTKEFFFKVLKINDELRAKIAAGETKAPIMLRKFEDAVFNGPGAKLASAEGTAWGALNAVTYVIDHEVGRTRDTGLFRAWLGEGADMKRAATRLAVDLAQAA